MDIASDVKVRIPRSHLNQLVEHPGLRFWREAFESGHARAQDPPQTLKLIQQVVRMQEEKDRSKRARGQGRRLTAS